MKFKITKTSIPGEYNDDGSTATKITKTPVFPRDWHTIALRTTIGIVLGLTVGTVAWSTYAIGDLLNGGLIGYIVAIIFDLAWITCLLLEYLARYDEARRTFPERLGWALLAVTMGALFWHGVDGEDSSLAGGVVGAAVSLFAKLLWLAVMKHTQVTLTDRDRDELARTRSEVEARLIITRERRRLAAVEQVAELERLAMERERLEALEMYGIAQDTTPAELPAPSLADMPKSDAIWRVHQEMPELTPAEIAGYLAEQGVKVEPRYVSQAIKRKGGRKAEAEVETPNVIELRK